MKTYREKLIYLASMIDGEGWISLQRSKRKKDSQAWTYMSNIGIANTNNILMEWLFNNFGGRINKKRKYKSQTGTKTIYEWRLNSTQSNILLKKVSRFLLLKRKQAETLLEMKKMHSKGFRGKRVPDIIQIKREALYIKLRKLNNTFHKIKKRFD